MIWDRSKPDKQLNSQGGNLEYNFNPVHKNRFGGSALGNLVRVRPTGVTVGMEAARRLGWTVEERHLDIAGDPHNQAIRLTKNPEGFAFGTGTSGKAVSVNLPDSLRRLQLPLGDYLPTEDPHVFVLAKGNTHSKFEQ